MGRRKLSLNCDCPGCEDNKRKMQATIASFAKRPQPSGSISSSNWQSTLSRQPQPQPSISLISSNVQSTSSPYWQSTLSRQPQPQPQPSISLISSNVQSNVMRSSSPYWQSTLSRQPQPQPSISLISSNVQSNVMRSSSPYWQSTLSRQPQPQPSISLISSNVQSTSSPYWQSTLSRQPQPQPSISLISSNVQSNVMRSSSSRQPQPQPSISLISSNVQSNVMRSSSSRQPQPQPSISLISSNVQSNVMRSSSSNCQSSLSRQPQPQPSVSLISSNVQSNVMRSSSSNWQSSLSHQPQPSISLISSNVQSNVMRSSSSNWQSSLSRQPQPQPSVSLISSNVQSNVMRSSSSNWQSSLSHQPQPSISLISSNVQSNVMQSSSSNWQTSSSRQPQPQPSVSLISSNVQSTTNVEKIKPTTSSLLKQAGPSSRQGRLRISSESDSDFAPPPPKKQATNAKKTNKMKTSSSSYSSDSDFEPKPAKKRPTNVDKIKPTTSSSLNKSGPIKAKNPSGKTTTFKRQRNVKPEDQESQLNFTSVKLKLKTIIGDTKKGERIIEQISKLSIQATKISSLATLLLLAKVNHFVDNNDHEFFNRNVNVVVADCFYEILDPVKHVQGKRRLAKFPQHLLPQFNNLMAQHNIVRPNNDRMGNMFKYLFQMYSVNFKTNVVLHARRRIMKYFDTMDDVTPLDRKRTVKYLFEVNSIVPASGLLLGRLRALQVNGQRYSNFTRGSLTDFLNDSDWFKLVPLFIRVQRVVEAYNYQWSHLWNNENKDPELEKERKKHKRIRPMAIVPISKYRRQHIRIDTEGLYRILMALKWLPRKTKNPNRDINFVEFVQREREFWNQYFNMNKIDEIRHKSTRKTKFHYQIHTDGVSASIVYEAKLSEATDNDKRLRSIKNKYESGLYKYQVGIDLGYNTYIAAVRRNPQTNKEVITKMKSKEFHRGTKNNVRKKKFNNLAGNFETRAAAHRTQFPVPPSPRGIHYWNYIDHCLRFWREGIDVYTTREYAKMGFDKYTNTQSFMDQITQKITNKSSTILFVGGAEFVPNSPIKGHVRCPGVRKLTKCIKKWDNCDVIFVDEYNTSQHCARCFKKFNVNTKKNRFKICDNCSADDNLMPAGDIVTKKSKRRMKFERKNWTPPYTQIAKYKKPLDSRNTIWQRDISAAKLILYKGLMALSGMPIHANLQRPRNINVDHDADDTDWEVQPPTIIW